MKTASSVFAFLAFGAFWQSCASNHNFNLGGAVIGLIFAILGAICASVADSDLKDQRDTDAKDRVEKVMKGEDSYFYLYLRPFSITNKVPMINPERTQVQDSLYPDRRLDFESVLTTALALRGIPLLALGKPGEAVGAGRYPTDDESWEDIFRKLGAAASGILVVPTLHPGTLLEVGWIVKNKQLSKTVFLQPDLGYGPEEWHTLVEKYSTMGICFPNSASSISNQMCKLDESGTIIATVPISTLWTPKGGAMVQELKLLLANPKPSRIVAPSSRYVGSAYRR
jgi:hypothetical protein